MICANCAGPTATPGLCLNCARIANQGRMNRMARAFDAAVNEFESFAGGSVDGDTLKNRAVLAGASPSSTQVDVKAAQAGSTPARQQPLKPQRVRFGPGEVCISESAWQRKERQQEAYFDAMQADVTGAYQWPTRECAGGCGKNVSGPWDKCLLCGSRDRHEVEFEEASNG